MHEWYFPVFSSVEMGIVVPHSYQCPISCGNGVDVASCRFQESKEAIGC